MEKGWHEQYSTSLLNINVVQEEQKLAQGKTSEFRTLAKKLPCVPYEHDVDLIITINHPCGRWKLLSYRRCNSLSEKRENEAELACSRIIFAEFLIHILRLCLEHAFPSRNNASQWGRKKNYAISARLYLIFNYAQMLLVQLYCSWNRKSRKVFSMTSLAKKNNILKRKYLSY